MQLERNKHIQYAALCFVSLLGLSSCSNEEFDVITSSDKEITFTTADWQDVPSDATRSTIFDKDNILDPAYGGGYFTVSAYTSDEGKQYFTNQHVWFFNDPLVNKWVFLDKNDELSTDKWYWPNEKNLNFFAYMPDSYYKNKEMDGYKFKETYITIGSYSTESGQSFTCNLPATVDVNTEMQEFIYAFCANQAKKYSDVILDFVHPYATINFRLGVDSYRMTIVSIQFDGIYLDGTYTTGLLTNMPYNFNPTNPPLNYDSEDYNPKDYGRGEWHPDETAGRKLYTMELNKRIPNQINYNTLLFDDFLVMPQSLEGVKLVLNYKRNTDSDEVESISINFSDIQNVAKEWQQGKHYTYSLKIGNNKDEIYFNVSEEDWIKNGETNIDVE